MTQWRSESDIVKVTVTRWHWQWHSHFDSDTEKVTMTQWHWHSESDCDTVTVTQLQWNNILFLLLVYLSDGFQVIAEGSIAQQREKVHGHTLLDSEVLVLVASIPLEMIIKENTSTLRLQHLPRWIYRLGILRHIYTVNFLVKLCLCLL